MKHKKDCPKSSRAAPGPCNGNKGCCQCTPCKEKDCGGSNGFRAVARIVMRGPDETDGLGLLALMDKNQKFFKRDTIYQIDEIMGELVIREVGPSAIRRNSRMSNFPACWGSDISSILHVCGKYLWLTIEEWKQQCELGERP